MNNNKLQFVGHATVRVSLGERHFMIDTNLSHRILNVFKRHQPAGIDLNTLPSIDALLVTHAHYDHLDIFSYKYFPQKTPIVCPRGIGQLLNRYLHNPVIELQPGQSHFIGECEIMAVKTRHFAYRVSGMRYNGAQGYIIKNSRHAIYHPGDTAYGDHFREIGSLCPIDVACLPIGGYKPLFLLERQHLNPHQAKQAFIDLKAKTMVPIHWGCFRLSLERLSEPLELLKGDSLPLADNQTIRYLNPGETLDLV